MLVLRRKAFQKIMIGDGIIVTIIGIRGDTVSVGIDAPKHIAVNREEIHEQILQDRASADSDCD